MGKHDRHVAVSDRRAVKQRPVARAEPDQLRLQVLGLRAAAGGESGRWLLRHILLRAAVAAPAARGGTDGDEGEQGGAEAHYIRSGASTPTRSRARAITVWVALTSASRNASVSLPSTRWWW